MELALVLQELLRRRRALAIGAAIALLAAVLTVYRPAGFGLKSRGLQHSSASTEVFVDTPSSVLGNVTQAIEPLQARATAYANFMASPAILSLIGQHTGLAGDRLYAAGPVDTSVPRVVEEPTAIVRNVQITGETAPYRLNFSSDPNLPTIGIAAQAPSTAGAIRLANAAAWALQRYVADLQASNGTPPNSRVVIRQLGSATGGVSDAGVSRALAFLAFLAVFAVWCLGMLALMRFRETWQVAASLGNASPGHAGGKGQGRRGGGRNGEVPPAGRAAVGRKLPRKGSATRRADVGRP